jgi:hypothetical protein
MGTTGFLDMLFVKMSIFVVIFSGIWDPYIGGYEGCILLGREAMLLSRWITKFRGNVLNQFAGQKKQSQQLPPKSLYISTKLHGATYRSTLLH